jgi:hypothetical protein
MGITGHPKVLKRTLSTEPDKSFAYFAVQENIALRQNDGKLFRCKPQPYLCGPAGTGALVTLNRN